MTADDLPAAWASLPPAWAAALPQWTPERFAQIVERVRAVSGAREIAPADPFRALRFAAPEQVKVVVFGQDPYPKPGHADGLAFSAGHGKPASLRRIFQVLAEDKPAAEEKPADEKPASKKDTPKKDAPAPKAAAPKKDAKKPK